MNKILLHDISDSAREEIIFALDSIDENCHLREVSCIIVDNHYVLRKTWDYKGFGVFGVSDNQLEALKRMYDYLKKEACEFLERGGYVLEDKIQLGD